jgi:ketosteroid isomerase-like protein
MDPTPAHRATVDAFYRAYATQDPEQIGAVITDDVEWHVAGPVDVMQVAGFWRGKAAVIDRFARVVPRHVKWKSLNIENLLVDGSSSAMFGRISCVHLRTGREICHRTAHIAHYRDGKVFFFRVINDSLDAAEQYVGHRIHLTDDAPPLGGDLFAV